MTPVTTFAGRQVALFGLGGSGLVTAQALRLGAAHVSAWDDAYSARQSAKAIGIDVVDLDAADWSRFAALILTPGVPLTHPKPHWTVAKAKTQAIEIIGDIELYCRERKQAAPRAPFIAITGTNGKSTTTALIAHMLRQDHRDVQVGGNIGTAVLALEPPADNRMHVIECSSFQIDLAPSINPTLGVLLNLVADHLDRHGTMESYAAVKERLVNGADVALISADDGFCRQIAAQSGRHRRGDRQRVTIPVSAQRRLEHGVFVEKTTIIAHTGEGGERVLANLAGITTLRGQHNAQNAAFAAAAADLLKLDPAAIQHGLSTFPGLPHRMEEVGRIGAVLFVNDSKATNADAAEKALLCFDRIFWIVGGKAKEGGIEPLRPLFSKIAKAYLIGAASDDFARTLDGHAIYQRCGTLDVAVRTAADDALKSGEPAPVVLLSPACASYDQYANFEVRGDHFRDLVRSVIAERTGDRHDFPR